MVINRTKASLAPPALQGNNSMRTALILSMFLTFLAAPAMAQGQNTFALNGTVHTFDATSIAVQNDDGGAVETFPLSPQLLVVQSTPATLSDIKPNDFIASAAVRKELLERYDLEIGGGVGAYAATVWRIGLMGYGCRRESVTLLLAALETCLRDAGQLVEPGSALCAASEVYNGAAQPMAV